MFNGGSVFSFGDSGGASMGNSKSSIGCSRSCRADMWMFPSGQCLLWPLGNCL